MKTKNLEEARALAQQARQWISTPAGRKELEKALDRTTQISEELDALRRIDPEKLHEPFTV